jgi:hypothetical protein
MTQVIQETNHGKHSNYTQRLYEGIGKNARQFD